MASFTTVGYGDLSPNTDNMRRFSLVFIALGVVLFPFLANQISRVLEIVTKKVSIESHLLTTLTVPLPSRHTCSLHVSRGTEPMSTHCCLRSSARSSGSPSTSASSISFSSTIILFCAPASGNQTKTHPRSLADTASQTQSLRVRVRQSLRIG